MDEFINNETIIKDDIYNVIKDSITCPICYNILKEPVMCMKCQNSFCKKCVDKMENIKCPNKCEEPNYQKSMMKINILVKLKFKCKYCKSIMSYEDALKHKNVCCTELIGSYEIIEDFPKIQRLTGEQMSNLKKENDELTYITSKK